MPTCFSELGITAAEEDLSLMAKKCAAATGGKKGSARVLTEPDMLAIYRMANH